MKPIFIAILLAFFSMSSCLQKGTEQTDLNQIEESSISHYRTYYYCSNPSGRCSSDIAKIVNYDTLIYVTTRMEKFGSYEEYHGKLTQINDSIYFVKCFHHISQRGNREKPFNFAKDTLFFNCDSSLINHELTIEYSNRKKDKYKIYSTENSFKIDENLYKADKDQIFLSFEYRHPITDGIVELKYEHYSNAVFKKQHYKKNKNDFYVIIKKDKITTINLANQHGSTSGPKFSLKQDKRF